jgi:hypothetical protein
MKRKAKVFVALLSFGAYLGISTTAQAESNRADGGSVSAWLVVVPTARPELGFSHSRIGHAVGDRRQDAGQGG